MEVPHQPVGLPDHFEVNQVRVGNEQEPVARSQRFKYPVGNELAVKNRVPGFAEDCVIESRLEKLGKLGDEVARLDQAFLESLHQTRAGDPSPDLLFGMPAVPLQSPIAAAEIERDENLPQIK